MTAIRTAALAYLDAVNAPLCPLTEEGYGGNTYVRALSAEEVEAGKARPRDRLLVALAKHFAATNGDGS